MPDKYYVITRNGTVCQCRFDVPPGAVRADSVTHARRIFLEFARKAISEPPVLRITPRAYQLSWHSVDGVQVAAGATTRVDSRGFALPLCNSGTPDGPLEGVGKDCASFAYYDGPEYNNAGRYYVHSDPDDTGRVFVCEAGVDNNMAEVLARHPNETAYENAERIRDALNAHVAVGGK